MEMLLPDWEKKEMNVEKAKEKAQLAASLLACIPMIVLYLIFQKQFIEGIATSGGKL